MIIYYYYYYYCHVIHAELPSLCHASDVMLCFAHDVTYLIKVVHITAGSFMLEMIPLERTSLYFNDVNSFNSFFIIRSLRKTLDEVWRVLLSCER